MYTNKKVKHNKLRNTGVIFELLTRQITSDILNNKDSKAIDIVKEFFNKHSPLLQELQLYQILTTANSLNEWKSNELLNTVLNSRKQLKESVLEKLKYNLIKRIREHYDINQFFNHKVNNYKVYASVYKLFEFTDADSPLDIVNSKATIIEHITKSQESNVQTLLEGEFGKEDKDIRLLAYKYLLEKFNDKYKDLDNHQKHLLRLYITNSPSNNNKILEYVTTSATLIQNELKRTIPKLYDSKVTQIKLSEVSELLESIKTTKVVKDTDVLSMLRYFELVKELKKL